MKLLWKTLIAAFPAICAAQDSFETPNFDVPKALLERGVNVSALPELAGLVERSSDLACSIACTYLKMLPGFEVSLQDSANYTTFTNAYWSTQQAEVSPYCVFKPSSAKQVSTVILISRLSRCPFAVKGGGHAAFEGSSSIEGGITIALEKFDEITVAADKSNVYIGPGNRWGNVYSELLKHDIAVVGGRVNDVGVSGLLLGGGISYFANFRGWACDNVESFELVTASGVILTITRKTYPDLYWGLRGGGNNFGVVTRFQLHAFPAGKMWGGPKLVANGDYEKALDATFKFGLTSAVNDTKGAQIISLGNQPGHGSLAQAFLTYAEPIETVPAMFKDWDKIATVQDSTGLHTLAELVTLMSAGVPDNMRETYWDVTFKLDRPLLSFLVKTFYELLPDIISAENLIPTVTIQLLTVPQMQQMQKYGGNALGLNPADGPLFIMNLASMYTNPADDHRVFKFQQDFITKVQAEAEKKGLNNNYIYMNYASAYQAVIASYGIANHKRLQSIAKFYDPSGVFQKLQPGYFKLNGEAPLGTFA